MLEETQPVRQPVAGPGVDRRVRPEIHVAEHPLAAVAMRPRPQDQPLPPASGAAQSGIVANRGRHVGIEPGRHVHALRSGCSAGTSPPFDAGPVPERSVRPVRPLREQIGLVIRMMAQRRLALPPGQAGEPVPDVLPGQRRAQHRIGHRFRRDLRVLERPGRLPQFEGAALADARSPGIVEPAAIQHLRHQPRRIEAAQRRLGMCRIGQPHGRDPPVAPGLRAQPGAGVDPVLPVRQVFHESAFGPVAAARVLIDHRIARGDERRGQRGAGGGGAVGRRDLAPAGQMPPVGRALQHHRQRPGAGRAVDVGGEAHAVAHRHQRSPRRHRPAYEPGSIQPILPSPRR